MLIRSLWGRSLTTSIIYSVRLDKQPVKAYFQNNFKAAREQVDKISKQFNIDNHLSGKLFNIHPQFYLPNSKKVRQLKQTCDFVKQLAKQDGKRGQIGRVLQKLKFQSIYFAFTMDKFALQSFVSAVQKYFEDQAQMQKIFSQWPNLMNRKFPTIINQKMTIMTEYLSLTPQQAMKAFEKTPYLLAMSTQRLRSSTVALLKTYLFTKQQAVELMGQMIQVFMLGGTVLVDIHKTYLQWGVNPKQMKQTLIKCPLLFFNYPYDVLRYKRKILRHMNFTKQMGRKTLLDYPHVLIWSVRSMEAKAIFITDRLEIQMDERTIQLLGFNFNKVLRPRGQILIRSKTKYNNDNIVSFMKLTDQQFADRTEVSLERLNEEIKKFPSTQEIDFKYKKLHDKLGFKQKYIKMANSYQTNH